MLVLTRKKNTSVLIGPHVVLIVRSIRAEEVLIHVLCPPDLPVRTTGFRPSDARPVPRLAIAAPSMVREAGGTWSLAPAEVRIDQALRIGEDITVTIEGLHFSDGLPTRVRLGIVAPRDVQIIRDELLARQPGPAEAPQA